MKKLLSLLSAVSLTATTASSVIACHKKYTPNSNDDNSENLKIYNEILKEINIRMNKFLFSEIIKTTGNNFELNNIYKKVNKNQQQYLLQKTDIEFSYFSNKIKEIISRINNEIAIEYSNYYSASFPINYDIDNIKVKIKYVDVKKIISDLNLNIINNIENFKTITFSVEFLYNVQFLNMDTLQNFYKYNSIVNDENVYNILQSKVLNYLNNNLFDFFTNLDKIDIFKNKNFSKFYNNFNIDFRNDDEIDNVYKNLFKDYIKNNQELSKINFSYNENTNFLIKKQTLFDQNDSKGLFNPIDKNKENYEHSEWADNSSLYKWINKEGYASEIDTITAENFINKVYKKWSIPKFNINTGSTLELLQSNLSWNFISIEGLVLQDNIKINDKEFISSIFISQKDLDTKLFNFVNLIVRFIKFYNINIADRGYHIYLNKNDFYSLNTEMTTHDVGQYLMDKFKNDNSNQNLPDIDLFSLGSFWKKGLTVCYWNGKNELLEVDLMGHSDQTLSIYKWDLSFKFGKNKESSIFYTAFSYNKKWNFIIYPKK